MSAHFAVSPTPRRGAVAVLVICLLGFLAGEVAATAALLIGVAVTHFPGGLNALARASRPPWWANVASLVGLWVGFGAAIAYASRPERGDAWPQRWAARPGDALYVLVGVGCQVVVSLAYAPFHVRSLNRPVHHLFGSAHGAALVLLGVLTIVGAPVVEEWFFRGVLFRGLRQGFGAESVVATTAAVVLSAVLFALAHGELAQFAGLAFLGVVLAVLVVRTGRLVPSVVAHASFNAVAFAALLARPGR